jgi:hypothetical protein
MFESEVEDPQVDEDTHVQEIRRRVGGGRCRP